MKQCNLCNFTQLYATLRNMQLYATMQLTQLYETLRNFMQHATLCNNATLHNFMQHATLCDNATYATMQLCNYMQLMQLYATI